MVRYRAHDLKIATRRFERGVAFFVSCGFFEYF
jgi:hypothetical protein